jgi:hypothetical protein
LDIAYFSFLQVDRLISRTYGQDHLVLFEGLLRAIDCLLGFCKPNTGQFAVDLNGFDLVAAAQRILYLG